MNQKIYAFHGIIDSKIDESVLSQRNLVSKEDYVSFLESIYNEIKSTSEVLLDGGGIAITIDDSTFASYNAALIAAKMGLKVSIFLNPWNIISQENYWFNFISQALDETRSKIVFYDYDFSIESIKGKDEFREYAKNKLRKLKADSLTNEFNKILKLLSIVKIQQLDYLRPIGISEIQELLKLGVDIQSHLWNHYDACYLTKEELFQSISATSEWIMKYTNKRPTLIATPFGEIFPNYNFSKDLFDFCLLLDYRYYPGFIGARYFNRLFINNKKIRSQL